MKQAFVISALLLGLGGFAPSAHAAVQTVADRSVATPEHVSELSLRAVNKAPTLRYVQARITPSQAKAIALSRVPGGEVVDIRRNGDIYRVRVIARDGRVIDIRVDANTGRIR